MSLIDNDSREMILREPQKPVPPTQGLNATDNDARRKRGAFVGLLFVGDNSDSALDFVPSLVKEFVPVRQN